MKLHTIALVLNFACYDYIAPISAFLSVSSSVQTLSKERIAFSNYAFKGASRVSTKQHYTNNRQSLVTRSSAMSSANSDADDVTDVTHTQTQNTKEPTLASILLSDTTKRLLIWVTFGCLAAYLRSFYSIILGTYLLAYAGNSAVKYIHRYSNGLIDYIRNGIGSKWQLLKKFPQVPRHICASLYITAILSVLSTATINSAPKVIREAQTLSREIQQDASDPYRVIAACIPNNLGDEAAVKIETFLVTITGDEGKKFAHNRAQAQGVFSKKKAEKEKVEKKRQQQTVAANTNSNAEDGSNHLHPGAASTNMDSSGSGDGDLGKAGAAAAAAGAAATKSSGLLMALTKGNIGKCHSPAWPEQRVVLLGGYINYIMKDMVAPLLRFSSTLVKESTGIIYKGLLSFLFSSMIIYDSPCLHRGISNLRNTRIRFVYDEVVPKISAFGRLVGTSFEVQAIIALINTTLTFIGMVLLRLPFKFFLSAVVLVCSFIPVAGVFISTIPMALISLVENGIIGFFQVVLMVLIVHAIEAYVVNPQLYANKLKLHPLAVLVSLYITEHLAGPQGLLLATPILVYFLKVLAPIDPSNTEDIAEDKGVGNKAS